MNIEAYDPDTLRLYIRRLQNENKRLKEQLRRAGIPYEETNPFADSGEMPAEYDPDQGGRIVHPVITQELAKQFFRMFWGRADVYARRGKNGGYFPQCDNRWDMQLCPKQRGEKQNCSECEHCAWTPMSSEKLCAHLRGRKEDGSDVLGIYPLLPDGTCRFLVFDFDNHEKGTEKSDFANTNDEWHEEVDALREICERNAIPHLVERSRSGRGAHVWIFFQKGIPAAIARGFGSLLLDKGASIINLRSFRYYDRMYPSQDVAAGLGSLIALPLQGRALRDGNSAFVDKNWNAYPDQWDRLLHRTPKISQGDLVNCMQQWQTELTGKDSLSAAELEKNRPRPWKREKSFSASDVSGKLHIVLSNGIYIDALNLMPQLQNQIRSMAAFDNPEYYKNLRLGYSNFDTSSAVYLGRDMDGYIHIPRGLLEELLQQCQKAHIEYDITDQRQKGKPLRISFLGTLKMQQDLSAEQMLANDFGILNAATAFGKTVVSAYMISERKVNTLILVPDKSLQEQWVEKLHQFLEIREELPYYLTKSGRSKQRKDVIGILNGTKNTLTGIIDVTTVGSLQDKDRAAAVLHNYGMILVDECHHCGADTYIQVMQETDARFVYGVSATLKRSDQLERIVLMLLGPIRYKYSALERAADQGIGHYVYPRYTRTVNLNPDKNNIHQAYALVSSDPVRNEMILDDTRNCVQEGRTPVILTRFKEQAKYLYENLQSSADHVLLLYGDNSDRENSHIRKQLNEIAAEESLILIATGSKIGEGFDYPRLDTLMLAAPVSADHLLEQFVGRLNRDYDGKEDAIVYDYVDSHIWQFDNMYGKRLRAYKKIGYSVYAANSAVKQRTNAIYDSGNYEDVFERDLVEAEKSIVISSPLLAYDKVKRFLQLVSLRLDVGCEVTVLTLDPDAVRHGDSEFYMEIIDEMRKCGVRIIMREEIAEHFAVIDKKLVWHGGMNLLGKSDAWDNLIRIHSPETAAELLEIAMGNLCM